MSTFMPLLTCLETKKRSFLPKCRIYEIVIPGARSYLVPHQFPVYLAPGTDCLKPRVSTAGRTLVPCKHQSLWLVAGDKASQLNEPGTEEVQRRQQGWSHA